MTNASSTPSHFFRRVGGGSFEALPLLGGPPTCCGWPCTVELVVVWHTPPLGGAIATPEALPEQTKTHIGFVVVVVVLGFCDVSITLLMVCLYGAYGSWLTFDRWMNEEAFAEGK